MKKLTSYVLALTLLLAGLAGCEREGTSDPDPLLNLARQARAVVCNNFAYADTLFFLREQTTPYVESPTAAQTGQYGAFPEGLSINASTGAINVNTSESGLKYRVWFLKAGVADTCIRYVTISGVNYPNKVYRLDQNDIMASPFYNAVRTFAPPCSDDDNDDDDDDNDDDDDDDDDDDCEFDDAPSVGQQVIPQGIAIDKTTGIINLRETVNNGTFGAIPVSGTSKQIRIYYRLNDASNKALNSIDVTVHWYATVSQVPASLLAQMNDKNGATLRRVAPSQHARQASTVANLAFGRPRPPDVVLIGR